MKKVLITLALLGLGAAIAFHYYDPDFSSLVDASSGDNGPIADIDRPLPHAVLPLADGNWVDLSSYKGQVVLISFWTTWCPGCVDEVPTLMHLQDEFGPKGFTVVGVAVDDQGDESVESFISKERFNLSGTPSAINYQIAMGNDDVNRELGFEGGLPMGILVNRDGKEVKIIRGTVSEAALSKAIRKLL